MEEAKGRVPSGLSICIFQSIKRRFSQTTLTRALFRRHFFHENPVAAVGLRRSEKGKDFKIVT